MNPGGTRVFVYGTLRAGERNHGLLADARLLGLARTAPRYRLVDLGDYPAMVPGGAGQVRGELYEVDGPTLAKLDELEGHPSYYLRAAVTLEDGAAAEAYLLAPAQAEGRAAIESGDWLGRGSASSR